MIEKLITEVEIKETSLKDLSNILSLWNNGDVMKYVGYPNGLEMSIERLQKWYKYVELNRPKLNHYSIYQRNLGYCGETFYSIDQFQYASLDIKLLSLARGKGIAAMALSLAIEEAFKHGANKVWVDPNPNNLNAIKLYKKLGFVEKLMPKHLIDREEIDSMDFKPVYMEKQNTM